MATGDGAVVSSVSCETCGKVGQWRRWPETTTWHGRMYLGSPSADGPVLCDECGAERVRFLLILGWDIHAHPYDVECGDSCPVRQSGHHWQIGLMRGVRGDRRMGFRVVKAIDGLPKVNGVTQLISLRAGRFLQQHPCLYYEPVASVDQLRRNLEWSARLEAAGVPRYSWRHQLLIIEVFESAYTAPAGKLGMPTANEKSLGLHCICPEAVAPDGTIRFWNSWGNNWGDHGCGYLSPDYLDRYWSEGWAQWNARWGSAPGKLRPEAIQDDRQLRRVWLNENPVFANRLKGHPKDSWRYECFYTASSFDGALVEGIQVRNGYGLRMGWAHMAHLEDSTTSEIRELFVMPAFRHQGIGSFLEGFASERAALAGSKEMRLLMHEADSIIGPPRAAARHFGSRRGYDWRWRVGAAPRTVAIGIKQLV